MPCKTWSQPDGNHIRGLCTNQFFAEGHTNNCVICAEPLLERRPCTSVCDPPLKAPRKFVLEILSELSLSSYPYPYTYLATLPPDHATLGPPRTFQIYDKMPTAEQIAAPCVLTATVYGENHSCEWIGDMTTSRWYRLTYDPPNGIFYTGEIYDPPEYGQRTAHPFDSCTPIGAYPHYDCSMQLWGHRWVLTMGPGVNNATLELQRDVARHYREVYSGGATSEILPISSTRGGGSKAILFDGLGGPKVWNVMPNTGFFSYPNTVPQTIGVAPNYQPSFAMFDYYTPMAKWQCSNICESRTEWIFSKTYDLANTTTTPGVTNDGRPMPVILGLPRQIALSIAE
jgi:hypothetical protein